MLAALNLLTLRALHPFMSWMDRRRKPEEE